MNSPVDSGYCITIYSALKFTAIKKDIRITSAHMPKLFF